ncbi:hypothetical protein [Staphylococcus massiliensis]|uniref:Uncharacterized protein n=1 Tax=Staphylococcus massiliensis S46 TaxID=1229783 RepID=K9B644_9STAP|nr:hypothetical protein [Staphylococcus massiliensis]EKU50287.1 hypothetical protein C273_01555 [Staphylococcus massiliensis S46]MCG3399687.1 hypothetical protein [Staphylococcus massiliensis]MCG3400792.1 hypothetical protein [Staphylococcus massiliensis]MCG3412044.1 hypothetical protein [Staphylococcus massiliensis]PNZ98645.1 hypothetical protein CD133_08230 [Staphylococcus massiliensis CCUG 55927]
MRMNTIFSHFKQKTWYLEDFIFLIYCMFITALVLSLFTPIVVAVIAGLIIGSLVYAVVFELDIFDFDSFLKNRKTNQKQ